MKNEGGWVVTDKERKIVLAGPFKSRADAWKVAEVTWDVAGEGNGRVVFLGPFEYTVIEGTTS